MTFSTINRKDARHALADFLRDNMPTAKNVLPYVPSTFKGQAPLVCMASAPTERIDDTPLSYENKFGISVRLVSLYHLENDATWTPEKAEDLLDDLEHEFSVALKLAGRATGQPWRAVSREGTSDIQALKLDGVTYLQEAIFIIVEVDD
jgi:hypothetical protein